MHQGAVERTLSGVIQNTGAFTYFSPENTIFQVPNGDFSVCIQIKTGTLYPPIHIDCSDNTFVITR